MKKILLFFILIAIATAGILEKTSAQGVPLASPVLFLTWSSDSYVPANFAGKVLPTANSQMTASVELVDGDRIADISKQNVYWYLNNEFLSGGIGMRRVSFRAPDAAGGTMDIRVEVPNYSKGSRLKTITIPIARPEAVIEKPFPGGKFFSSPVQLVGQPYFFNAARPSSLNFRWAVNGQTPTGAENPQNLSVKFGTIIEPGAPLSVSLSIENSDKKFPYETASKNMDIVYSQ